MLLHNEQINLGKYDLPPFEPPLQLKVSFTRYDRPIDSSKTII